MDEFSGLKCNGECRSFAYRALHRNSASQAGNMTVNQVKPDAFTVVLIVKSLVETEDLILILGTVKTDSIIRESELLKVVF